MSSISSARLRPTARETSTIGVEQKRPMRTPGVAKRASSLATARSQAATSWQPAAVAMPCTCAITGCGRRWIAIISSLQVSNSSRASGSEQPGHLGEVVARAERRALAAHDDGVHRGVGRRLGERGEQIAQQRQRERVAALGPVEHERAHACGVLDAERGGGDGCHAPRIPPQTASSACGVGSKR